MTAVHVVVPEGIDDPARPSGGNTYDRRVCRGLAPRLVGARARRIRRLAAPDAAALRRPRGVIRRMPDGAVVLLDGLVASTAPEVLVPHARRLRLVVLVHMPLGDRAVGVPDDIHDARTRESAVLSAAAAVVTTGLWVDPPSAARPPERRPAADYASTRLVNFRIPVDLHERFRGLVREVEVGHPRLRWPSLTELVIALLEEGPQTADEVAELIRRKRAAEHEER